MSDAVGLQSQKDQVAFGVKVGELEKVGRKYMELPGDAQRAIMQAPLLGGFSNGARECYVYITTKCLDEKGKFVIPAMLIPAMVGNAYESKKDQENFVKRYLKTMGKEGVDWVFFTKRELLQPPSTSEGLCFPVPGGGGKQLVFSSADAPQKRYPFVTPEFARHLVSSTGQEISRELRSIHFAIHDETVKFLMGRPSQLDGLIQARKKRRIEACDTVKTLAQTILEVHPGSGPREFSAVNGMTNRAVTGKTKTEWAREWGKQPKSVNLRDHMNTETLAATTALQAASAATIEMHPQEDVLRLHAHKCTLMDELFGDFHARSVTTNRLTLTNARDPNFGRSSNAHLTNGDTDGGIRRFLTAPSAGIPVAEVVEE